MGVAKNLSLEDLAEIMPDVAGSLQVRTIGIIEILPKGKVYKESFELRLCMR